MQTAMNHCCFVVTIILMTRTMYKVGNAIMNHTCNPKYNSYHVNFCAAIIKLSLLLYIISTVRDVAKAILGSDR